MWMSALWISLSLVLLASWLLYMCRALLQARSSRDYASMVAGVNRLQFPEILDCLENGDPVDPEWVDALDADFDVVLLLLRHSAGDARIGWEGWLLRGRYWLAKCSFRMARSFSSSPGREHLQVMALVVGYFADAMGERITAVEAV
jgi:hypothetical protein